jgi:hypothetical protein
MPGSVYTGSGVDPKSYIAEQDEFIDYITRNSQKRWVTIIDGYYEYALQVLLRKPFFLFVYIDASLSTRWTRYKDRCVYLRAASAQQTTNVLLMLMLLQMRCEGATDTRY